MVARALRQMLCVALGVSSACAVEEQVLPISEETATYVGPLEGSDAIVAVSVSGNDVVAYVCGGETSFATSTKWFRGPLDLASRSATLEASDGARMDLTIDVDEGTLSGSLGETSVSLSRIESTDGDARGLYTTVEDGCRTGVIVYGEPDAVRMQGTWCRVEADGQSIFAQVTPILPIGVQEGELRVKVSRTEGDDHWLVTRLLDPEALR